MTSATSRSRSAAPDLWDDPDAAQKITSRLSHLQAELAARVGGLRGRIDDLEVLFELAREEADADTLRRGRGRAGGRPQEAVDELEVRTLLSGEYDEREALVNIRAEAGGVDAADFAEMLHADVPALGRAARLPDRGLRHLVRRGGRHQVDHLRRPGAVRLRHALRRAGHPPAGADLAVRQPGPPPDLVRRRRGAAGGRADRPRRDRRVRAARRRLPLVRPRRPGRQHHRLRGPA